MAIVNWTKRVTGGGNGPYDGPDATIENPIRIAGGYSFVYKDSSGFTGTLKIFGSFQIGTDDQPVGGFVTGITFVTKNGTSVYTGFSIPTATLLSDIHDNSYDVIWALGFAGADTLTGSLFDDNLWGYAGNDSIVAGQGDDWLFGGKGNDLLLGGRGEDAASYFAATKGVTVSLAIQGRAQNTNGDGRDTLVSIEKLEGSQFADSLTGSAYGDLLKGLGGKDTLIGGKGDDWLVGGKGNDRLNGGAGLDGVSYYAATAGVSVELLRLNQAQNTASDGFDRLISIEKLEGSDFADFLGGSSRADTLIGLDGDDTLSAFDGDDWFYGGLGNDVIDGSLGLDGASYASASAGVQVSLALMYGSQNTGAAGVDTLSEIEKLEGSAYNDRLTGSNAIDTLSGLDGNDTLNGGDGNDWLLGGTGNDRMVGGAGVDGASYVRADGGVTVSLLLQNQVQSTGSEGRDTLIGIEKLEGSNFADRLTGSNGTNLIWGLSGGDRIDAKAGNDTVIGGYGSDDMAGGGGDDEFRFYADELGDDRIRDFDVTGNDLLSFQDNIFSSAAAALAATVDTPDGAKITWADGSVLLTGVTRQDLTLADYFVFV